jgi:DNA-3-methyladenine glycosylase
MAAKISGGLLLFRRRDGKIEVLLGHPGSPYWSKKDDGAWTIPKGLIGPKEDAYAAALREFREETGHAPGGEPVSLGGKLVKVWAIEGDWDADRLQSNTFEMEWPPHSRKMQSFPELNEARWFSASAARKKILKGQAVFIDRLCQILDQTQPDHDTVLTAAFFDRPAAIVARELLGKMIVRSFDQERISFCITETEAYEGEHDLACHSAKGRTARTEVMFGPAGRFYVYRIYGLHWMLNVVTGRVGEGAAVLIRGVDGVSGPGRVAAALKIDSTFTGREATSASALWFKAPPAAKKMRVKRTARIGVHYAGPVWANKKLRFIIDV